MSKITVDFILDEDVRKTVANANITISQTLKALAEYTEKLGGDDSDKSAAILTLTAHINSTIALLISLPTSTEFHNLVKFTSDQAKKVLDNLENFETLPIGSESVTLTVVTEEMEEER